MDQQITNSTYFPPQFTTLLSTIFPHRNSHTFAEIPSKLTYFCTSPTSFSSVFQITPYTTYRIITTPLYCCHVHHDHLAPPTTPSPANTRVAPILSLFPSPNSHIKHSVYIRVNIMVNMKFLRCVHQMQELQAKRTF